MSYRDRPAKPARIQNKRKQRVAAQVPRPIRDEWDIWDPPTPSGAVTLWLVIVLALVVHGALWLMGD